MPKFYKLIFILVLVVLFQFVFMQMVYAQADPTAEISAIIGRIVTIATRVGSALLILFIVKDAFELLSGGGDNPILRGKLVRDAFVLIIATILLFKPAFILDAIKYIANV